MDNRWIFIPTIEKPVISHPKYKRDVVEVYLPVHINKNCKYKLVPFFTEYDHCYEYLENLKQRIDESLYNTFGFKILPIPEIVLPSLVYRYKNFHNNTDIKFINLSNDIKVDFSFYKKTTKGFHFTLLDIIVMDSMKRLYDGDFEDE